MQYFVYVGVSRMSDTFVNYFGGSSVSLKPKTVDIIVKLESSGTVYSKVHNHCMNKYIKLINILNKYPQLQTDISVLDGTVRACKDKVTYSTHVRLRLPVTKLKYFGGLTKRHRFKLHSMSSSVYIHYMRPDVDVGKEELERVLWRLCMMNQDDSSDGILVSSCKIHYTEFCYPLSSSFEKKRTSWYALGFDSAIPELSIYGYMWTKVCKAS